jgi:hypothetical protein
MFQRVEELGDRTSNSSPESDAAVCQVAPAPNERLKRIALASNVILPYGTLNDSNLPRRSELIGTNITRTEEIGKAKRKRPLLPNIFVPTAGLTVAEYNNMFLKLPGARISPDQVTVSRSPWSTRPETMEFFLRFHAERITSAHYIVWFDYYELHTKHLHSMAESCNALRYALVAFSALVYSTKHRLPGNEIALFYYTMAMKELQLLLNDLADADSEVALATALQLSTFDVHFPAR